MKITVVMVEYQNVRVRKAAGINTATDYMELVRLLRRYLPKSSGRLDAAAKKKKNVSKFYWTLNR